MKDHHGTMHCENNEQRQAATATPHEASTAALDQGAPVTSQTRAEQEQWRMRGLEETLLHPVRLLIMSTLVSDHAYRARYTGDAAGIPRKTLTRHIHAGYLRSTRGVYSELWIRRTPDRRHLFTGHVTALNALLDAGRLRHSTRYIRVHDLKTDRHHNPVSPDRPGWTQQRKRRTDGNHRRPLSDTTRRVPTGWILISGPSTVRVFGL